MSVSVPVTRGLPAVLRQLLDAGPGVQLLVGVFAPAADPSNAYASVILQGQTIRVPCLRSVTETPGAPAYLLATKDFVLCIGSVTV